ncbi:MAG: tetratricopeptide repeat protein [Alphaproteobacteria bacterium]
MRRPDAPDPAFAAALSLHRAGRLGDAMAGYRAILARRPDHVPAMHHLGVAALAAGEREEAEKALRAAARAAPRDAAVRYDHGHALAALGRLDDAAATWAEAGRIAPRMADAHANRGAALAALGHFTPAADAFRDALRADPNHRLAAVGIADMLLRAGRIEEAISAADRARVRLGPIADVATVKALALRAKGDRIAAAQLLEQAVATEPGHAGAWGALGLARLDGGDAEGAAAALARAEALDPTTAETPFNRATAERARDRLGAAIAALERALARRPGFPAAELNLAYLLLEQGRVAEADQAFDSMLAVDPDHGRAASGKLFALNYRADLDPGAVAAAHRGWGERFAPLPPPRTFANPPDPERRLRVGYVSADLRAHSVAWFAGPVFAAHDRDAVEVVAYADVTTPDATTAALRDKVDLWRPIGGMADAEVFAMIEADRVDVLVDLGGHTAWNRLGVFARRAAPVQASWLGYPHPTGVAAIDIRITDAVADPPEADVPAAGERLVRLGRPFLAYAPPPDAGPVSARPAGAPPVFASFNVLPKISAATVAAWAGILAAVPGSRLLLKARGLDDPDTAALWRARFAAAGVAPDRLDLRGRVASTAAHLAVYDAVDIALDPFPYNGTTTTLEALWMGVPVVTLAGDRHAGRVGAAILRPLGLDDLVAADAGAYVASAVALATDAHRRATIRAELRQRLAASPLLDATDFTRAMEGALRAEWRRWCGAAPQLAAVHNNP